MWRMVAAVVHARFNYVAILIFPIVALAIACDRMAIVVENIAFDQRIATVGYDNAVAKTSAVAIVVKKAIADADHTDGFIAKQAEPLPCRPRSRSPPRPHRSKRRCPCSRLRCGGSMGLLIPGLFG